MNFFISCQHVFGKESLDTPCCCLPPDPFDRCASPSAWFGDTRMQPPCLLPSLCFTFVLQSHISASHWGTEFVTKTPAVKESENIVSNLLVSATQESVQKQGGVPITASRVGLNSFVLHMRKLRLGRGMLFADGHIPGLWLTVPGVPPYCSCTLSTGLLVSWSVTESNSLER